MDRLNIFLSVNSKFLEPLKVLLFSLYKTQLNLCNIYLANISLSGSEILDIKNLCLSFNYSFKEIKLNNDILKILKSKQSDLSTFKLSIETYSRLFMPYMLQDVDRILWLDADCLVLRDLSDFYFQDLEGKCIAACDHCNWIIPTIPEFAYYDYPNRKESGEYFNAGVILFDLNQCRKIKGFIHNNMLNVIENLKCDYFDQGILNFLIPKDRVKWNNTLLYNTCINQNWNGSFNNHPIRYNIFNNSYILHYCSPNKPWDLCNSMDWSSRKYWINTFIEYNEYKNSL